MVIEMTATTLAQAGVLGAHVVRDATVHEGYGQSRLIGHVRTMEWGPECTDEQLMLACQRGNEKALDALYQRYYRPVLTFIYRIVQDSHLAEDLTQETFLRIYNNRLNWMPKSKFTSWLYRIARNLCIDEKRRYWNRLVTADSQFHDADEENTSFMDRVEDNSMNARETCASKIDERMIQEAVNQLSEEQREVIILNKYQGLTYIEIADIIGVTPESVKQRAYRAHLRLREILEPILGEY